MQINMAAALTLKWVAHGLVTVNEIHGYNNQATDLYIQLHEVPPLSDGSLTASAVPAVKSLRAVTKTHFQFTFPGGLTLSQLLVAVSTTEPNYTSTGAGSSALDMTLDVDTVHPVTSTTVVVGDLTTTVESLQVWAVANGTQRLLQITAKNLEAFDVYLAMFNKDFTDVSDGQTPIRSLKVPTGGALYTFNFGDGMLPEHLVGVKACTLIESAGPLAPKVLDTAAVSAGMNIRAIYDAIGAL